MNKKQNGLASDYVQGARNFLWAAEQLNIVAPQRSTEGMFIAEDPIYLLLGHSAELLLKSILAKSGVSIDGLRNKYGHDLEKLIVKARECQVLLDTHFLSNLECIADNYKNHEYRYGRSFGGFSDEDHEKWKKGELTKKEIKEYGLIVKSGINIDQFIKGLSNQLVIVVEFINKSEAA